MNKFDEDIVNGVDEKRMREVNVRTPKTREKYIQYKKDVAAGKQKWGLDDVESRAKKKFKYWVILSNDFPYDAIASVNDMLFTKRKVAFDWDQLTKEELEELNKIKKEYLPKHYDVVWENLPNTQSVPGHFHLHLLKLKVGKNKN